MKLVEYKDEILLKLGFPIVEVEIEELIERVIVASFREIRKYINLTKVVTVPFSNAIDLSKFKDKVQAIQYVARDRTTATDSNLIDAFYLATTQMNTSGSISDYTRYLTIQQLKDTISQDLDYTHVGNTLYISCTFPEPTSISIFYTPVFKSVEEVDDDYWNDIIMRFSLANSKVILGRVRGKYTNNTALYNLDGEALLSEGNQELSELRQFLSDNFDVLLPLD